MKRKQYAKIFLLLISSILLIITIIPSINSDESSNLQSRSILYVGGGGQGNYSTIQSAIDAASSGDTIYVFNGIYNEQINIDKTISTNVFEFTNRAKFLAFSSSWNKVKTITLIAFVKENITANKINILLIFSKFDKNLLEKLKIETTIKIKMKVIKILLDMFPI